MLLPVVLFTIIFGASSTISDTAKSLEENDLQKRYMALFSLEAPEYQSFNRKAMSRDLSMSTKGCTNGTLFSSFRPECRKCVMDVGGMLMGEKTASGMMEMANELKSDPNLHPMCWFSGLTMATLQRPDLQNISKPSPVDVTPETFIDYKAIKRAKEHPERCVLLDEKFGADNGIENGLWYFREDIQVNSQHWFWHLIYPATSKMPYHSDRRGELFYYFHHQLVTRYYADRLSNGLGRVKNIRLDPTFVMEVGYNSHLYDPISTRYYVPRKNFTPLPPSVENGKLPLLSLMTWNSRLIQSIETETFLYSNNSMITITPLAGFDTLGDTVECSTWTANLNYYGSLHSFGHDYIGYSTVWNVTKAKVYGVMEDLSTAMRDPTFYQWHGYLDVLFRSFKNKLPPYQLTKGDFPLVWKQVELKKVYLRSGKFLHTFWCLKNLTLTRRLNFYGDNRQPYKICAKNLNHKKFRYMFSVVSEGSKPRDATMRIFMAPRYDEEGSRFSLEEQMSLFFAMDSYKVTLEPGENKLVRWSSDSTLTIPWQRTVSGLSGELTYDKATCGCGWPEHMLLPKGSAKGTVFDLVAMVTDGTEDAVEEDNSKVTQSCKPAFIIGGVWGKKYPDKKPMGYPFDRLPFKKFKDLEEYVDAIHNMATTQITIVHTDKIKSC